MLDQIITYPAEFNAADTSLALIDKISIEFCKQGTSQK